MIKGLIFRVMAGVLTLAIGGTSADYYKEYHYRQIWRQHRESQLRGDLQRLRVALDQFARDKRELPRSLDELVDEQYLSGIPVDPIIYRQNWKIVIGSDPNSVNTRHGIVDVHSFSTEVSSNGSPYSEW